MPLTTPAHVNPFVDGVDVHSPSPAPSPKPQSPAVSSSRPLESTGPLGRLTSLSARAQGTPSRSTNLFDTPRVGTNSFDTPRVGTNSFDTPRVGMNPFDTPRMGMNPFDTPKVDPNRLDSSKVGTGSFNSVDDEHVSDEVPSEVPGEVPGEAHTTVAAPPGPDVSPRPLVEPEPGVYLPALRIAPRTPVEEEVVSPAFAWGVSSPHGTVETPSTAHPVSALGPRADTTAAFAKLRNRHGQVPPSRPSTPHPDATPRHDDAQPDAKLVEAEHEALPAQSPPAEQPHNEQPHNEQPHNAPNSAAQFAAGTMEQTGEFMSPMIQAQMFAAESQMFISMVQAQVDVAKAAASAVADAARKS